MQSFSQRLTRQPHAFDPAPAAEIAALFADLAPDLRGLLANTAGCSPYLKDLMSHEADWLRPALHQPPETAFAALLASLDTIPTEDLSRALREVKRRAALLTALADLGGVWPTMTVTQALTDLADRAVDLCLTRLVAEEIRRGKLPGATPDDAQTAGGMFALAMGKMGAGLDTGDMLLAQPVAIAADDTAASLHDRLAALGAQLIVDALDRAAQGRLRRQPQPDAGATYAAKIDKREAAVDWTLPAAVLERRLRAFDPFPGASSALGGEIVKLWRGRVVEGRGAPGAIIAADDAGIVVACGDGALCVVELQRAGGRRVAPAQFLAGRALAPGTHFGAKD